MAVRDPERAAAALGVSTRAVKRQALVLSAVLTGLLGGSIEPNSMFGLNWTVTALVMVVVGGMGTVAGPIVGAFVIYYLVDRALDSQPVLQALLSGVLVIVVIELAPNGIVGVLRAGVDALIRRPAAAAPPAPALIHESRNPARGCTRRGDPRPARRWRSRATSSRSGCGLLR